MQSVDELSILRAPMLKLRCSIRKTYLRGQLRTSRSQKVDFSCLSKVAVFLLQVRGSALFKHQSFLVIGQSFLESAALEGETAGPLLFSAVERVSENPALSAFGN